MRLIIMCLVFNFFVSVFFFNNVKNVLYSLQHQPQNRTINDRSYTDCAKPKGAAVYIYFSYTT